LPVQGQHETNNAHGVDLGEDGVRGARQERARRQIKRKREGSREGRSGDGEARGIPAEWCRRRGSGTPTGDSKEAQWEQLRPWLMSRP
jgi:hypothetical protein